MTRTNEVRIGGCDHHSGSITIMIREIAGVPCVIMQEDNEHMSPNSKPHETVVGIAQVDCSAKWGLVSSISMAPISKWAITKIRTVDQEIAIEEE
jgi:hypothetical protein